ncbi:undecaprenyldiphospho-muramoylpentapeptide beta-N-acetylglucosaminyltransferase [Flavisolibacter ginsenosidimutans]|uniref:UDP-N-acetylglucosamine--N-acetylmuramyl-(pentapeptide) pyrophosphoryl-undecaprenol N-acetylglucosamine transferase n=1 Tax=Flavisolibacter ginsenosidimutans TaxID=661481 RepID=A0A5B8UHX3_9BACT|nr:undecaprenyldiphospho-muramoylpentapeptide beta-N-acetylglucosaminyltransferase [Flavisolibacter ginsenosidimutans]QEC56032.1 undecaprenyldiphospho-muramoylpentapeptide beta-N-acetylglucosaminyltransferase [Flavisolibacter ginsenosidimutans]
MAKRIIIAGGGTGGHIFPAIAIANALKKADNTVEILFVGAKGKMEMEKVPQAGYKIEGLDIAGFNRSSLIKNISLPAKLVKSFLQVRRIFKKFVPNAVIGVGGYSSFPVLRFAQAKGIPSFVHESNSFAGKSNMLLGKKATKVFVASDNMQQFFPQEKIMITGNPVRPDIVNVATVAKEEALRFFNLQPGKKTVLIVGGSLGARSINEAIENGLIELTNAGLQLIWQTGKTGAQRWEDAAAKKENVWVSDFIKEMQYAYAAADIVVSRAGAMAIAELCVVRKPVLFVPYPFAAEDHQTVNAQNLVKKDAALMVKDSEAKEKVVSTIIALANDETKQTKLKENISALAVTDADKKIADEILKTIN